MTGTFKVVERGEGIAAPTASGLFPGGSPGQKLLEPGNLGSHVWTCVVTRQEPRQRFFEKSLPRFILVTRVDRVEERTVRFGGVQVTGRVADHQDFVGIVAANRGQRQMFLLAAKFLAGDEARPKV